MSKKQYHFLYKTMCLITNNFYIGMHTTYDLNDGYLGSGVNLKKSVLKYGKENHKVEILEYFKNKEDLKLKEQKIVNESLLKDPNCLNIKYGGLGWWGPKGVAIGGDKCKAANEYWKIPENKQQMSEHTASRNKKLWKNEEYRNKILPNLTFKNKKHSEESKRKIGLANSKYIGEKNSQFGTCWIYNEETKECKKIKKEELKDYLNNNWKKGRKMKF